MKYGVYAVRDKASCFMSPIVDATDQSAIRNFARAVNQDGSLMDFSPSDFDLYLIGHYDDQTGALAPADPIQFIAAGSSLIGGYKNA